MTPGQYTGQQKITPLSKEAHNAGYQAWAKKVWNELSAMKLKHSEVFPFSTKYLLSTLGSSAKHCTCVCVSIIIIIVKITVILLENVPWTSSCG